MTLSKTIVISKGNSKLGNIPSFSLPSLSTCPGKSIWCSSSCYAKKIERIYPNVRNSYSKNYVASLTAEFTITMDKEIKRMISKGIKIMRIHVAGDFYNKEYVQKWQDIISANPGMHFYTYTRSWTQKDILPSLEALKLNSNLTMFASIDSDMTQPIPNGWRVAMAGDINNFSIPKTVMCLEQANKVNGCDKCRLCFNNKITLNIYFKTH